MEQQACLEQIGTLCTATWALRDRLLEQGSITPEVVRLEEAAHLLERSIRQLATVLRANVPHGCGPIGKPHISI